MKRLFSVLAIALASAFWANADVQVINGKKYECSDGMCRLVEEPAPAAQATESLAAQAEAVPSARTDDAAVARMAQGYMSADAFVAFLEGREDGEEGRLARSTGWLLVILVLLGGLAMNLTPCVLPMIPINLIVIGRSARRGTAYGLGIALAYGALGVAAAFGGLAFGSIQGNPWFNAAVALVFVGLGLALFDVFFIDLSRFRPSSPFGTSPLRQSPNHPINPSIDQSVNQSPNQSVNQSIAQSVNRTIEQSNNRTILPHLFPFLMGALSAVLAGACVAPVLISVLLLTAKLTAQGGRLAVLLPFAMGVGMALPWPFVGAGLRVLPKPGAWMKNVNRFFGLVVLGFAVWYGVLAGRGFVADAERPAASGDRTATPATLAAKLRTLPRPVLVDCWATWCKNCAAMDRVLGEGPVREKLKAFTLLRVQAEDISELRKVRGFEEVRGLPAFVIFE